MVSSATTTSLVELPSLPPLDTRAASPVTSPSVANGLTQESPRDLSSLPAPTTATETLQRWNHPKSNTLKVISCFWTFIVMGTNDAGYGALLPYIEKYYGITHIIVSLIFLSPFVGYTVSAMLNNYIHIKSGQRGVAVISSLCHLTAFIIMVLHPPFPVLVVSFVLVGFGTGLADAAWNAWLGNMANANELLGFLHGFYGLGAVISPLIATAMVTKAGLPWYAFYYVMIGFAALETAISVMAFWEATAAKYQESVAVHDSEGTGGTLKEALLKRPYAWPTWLCALFLLGYVGVEVALGGWIVLFMIQVRGGAEFESGITATGFWLGLTVGRVILGFVTPRIGEKLAISIYLPITMGLELLFWLVPQFIVSAIAIGLQGFFLGPLFPAAMVAMAKILPRHLHVSAIGFAAAFGGSGGALFPFAVGAIAQSHGVQVLQPIALAILAVIWALWLAMPKFNNKRD